MIEQTVEMTDGSRRMLRSFLEENFVQPKVEVCLRDPDTKEVRVVKVGRNEPCPCGSGEKFKKCCIWKVNCGVEIVT